MGVLNNKVLKENLCFLLMYNKITVFYKFANLLLAPCVFIVSSPSNIVFFYISYKCTNSPLTGWKVGVLSSPTKVKPQFMGRTSSQCSFVLGWRKFVWKFERKWEQMDLLDSPHISNRRARKSFCEITQLANALSKENTFRFSFHSIFEGTYLTTRKWDKRYKYVKKPGF